MNRTSATQKKSLLRKIKRMTHRWILGAILLITCFSHCTSPKKVKTFKLGFSQCTGDDYWRKTQLEGMKRELSFHPGTTLLYKDAKDNTQLQIKQVRALLDAGIDLLLISPNEAQPLTKVVDEAYSKGVPVIIIDRKTSSALYTSFVGADNTAIGSMAARYIARLLDHKGKIIQIIGRPGSSPAIERQSGFSSVMQAYPDMEVIANIYGNWLKSDAAAALHKIKDKLVEADVVFAQNDVMALGAYEVYKSLGIQKPVKFIGVDGLAGSGGGLQLVQDKILNATMLYSTGGEEAIQTAFKILNGEPFNKENLLQTIVIDSSNARSIRLQAEKISSQQIDIEKQQDLLEEQQRIYKNQSILLNIFITALILVLVLGCLAFLAMRGNRRINRRLAAKNQEILDQRNQLVAMTEKTKEMTEAKFNFFTNISHEFRTPLTLILAPLEEVLQSPKLHFTIKGPLGLVQKNVFRLLKLVNQLMDFRKVEYERMALKSSENNLVSFVTDIAHSFGEMAKRKNITLHINYKVTELTVWFDTNMLDKVLFNLLSNAFKFTNNNGKVTISMDTSPDQKEAFIKIEDTGIGMDEEAVEHAFDLFYQGHGAKYKGSGLGLTLSKELIRLHQGKIELESKKWEGTCFTIHLPLGDQHLSAAQKVNQADRAITPLYDEVKIYTTEAKSDPDLDQQISAKDKEFTILLIEDSDDLRGFLNYRLSTDYEILGAATGNEGITKVYEFVPDLIICDLALPGTDGLEITRTIKTDIRSSHIPVIILTANTSMEKKIESMKQTADAFITKPFSLEYLEQTIQSLLKNRRMLRDHYTSELPREIQSDYPIKKMDRKFINEFTAIIEKNIDNEHFSIDELCKLTGVSRVQLYRKIKALLGVNVNEYILKVRLQRAKYLLKNEDLTIGEVAFRVGFSSQAYFSTVFKSKIGCTPKEFKER